MFCDSTWVLNRKILLLVLVLLLRCSSIETEDGIKVKRLNSQPVNKNRYVCRSMAKKFKGAHKNVLIVSATK